ncbi:MAG: hypothetical protein JKY65_24180 [Planctomycetes bacterium]|nr:hypothetical protein [Planctomycetota bacterium]
MSHLAPLPIALALSLALGGLALGQDFELRGEQLSGRVRVADGLAKFSVLRGSAKEVRDYETKAEPLPGGGVRLTFSVSAKTPALQGMLAWLRKPRFNRQAWKPKVRVVIADMLPTAPGVLQGSVDGEDQTWTLRIRAQDSWTVLVIPGLSTNSWNKIGIPYLDENLRALRARGLRARRLEIKTEDGVLKNAAYIAGEVRAEAKLGRRVVLLAHSKGGTDVTAAIALYADIRKHVVGVIAIQPVYNGSYVADLVAKQKVLRGSMAFVFEKVFKGQRDAVIDLTHEKRAAFVAAHPYPAATIPTIVIRSTFNRRLSKSALYATQKYIKARHELESDGLVTLADQTIPGAAQTISLADLDHFEPGVRLESPHRPIDVTNVGLDALQAALARRRPAASQPQAQIGLPLGR